MEMNIEDTYLYFYIIWKTITGSETTNLKTALNGVFDTVSKGYSYQQVLISKENELIKRNLVEIQEAHFINDTELKLTEKSINLLKEEGIALYGNLKIKNVIEPSKISIKELYYMSDEQQQISMIRDLMIDSKLTEIQERLVSKKLPKGITTLFYGATGTGKTETVLQIARETNREIIKVDISESKSMWFGQSEKIIKRIFTDYKEYTKHCERIPILLFNEADAIISKRKESMNANTDQTENTIQNIILEELENFQGIFFATTNLANNFDLAFERRFLFKIEFQKPDSTVKAKIWQSKLQTVASSDCERLAKAFDFSGGQIDNIVRKSEMHEIITGEKANIEKFIEFCNAEHLHKTNRIKIGFLNN